jgi:hypothetical protein
MQLQVYCCVNFKAHKLLPLFKHTVRMHDFAEIPPFTFFMSLFVKLETITFVKVNLPFKFIFFIF